MERKSIIDNFIEFLRDNYYEDLAKTITKGEKSLQIDFNLLDRFDPELADAILEKPEETLQLFEDAVEQIDLPQKTKVKIRFFNIPESHRIRIRNIRAEHIGKLIAVDGIVKRASEIRPEVAEVVFSCPECGRELTVIQTERTITSPLECECGNKKNFRLLKNKQKLYDARWIAIEEPFEIVSGERPSEIMVFLKEDLTTPKMQNKTDPGNRIKIVGILKELPRRLKGTRSRQVEIYIEANSLESIEVEWEELEITPEDEKRILELAKDPEIYTKLVMSIAPSLYGLEEVKEAVVLQLFGGEHHVQKDKARVRGDIHILLIGDPSCLVEDERIILGNGAIAKISSLGKRHLQKINVPVYLGEGYKCGIAKVFHKYEFQPIIEIVTESGKSIKGTFNQPVLVKKKLSKLENFISEWKRLDEIKIGDEVKVIDRIPCSIRKYVETGWRSKGSSRRKKIKVPKFLDEKLAGILGYLLANGYVGKDRVGCRLNDEELDLLPKIEKFFEEVFGIKARLDYHKEKNDTNVEIVFDSVELTEILRFLKNKRIPEIILSSKNSVVSMFLSWLYDGGGSIILKGRGKNAILYKAKDIEMLRDIQTLFLRFGIHSKIYGNILMIKQANSIIKFADSIGFNSKKKKERLQKLVESVRKLRRKRYNKRWEKIVKIIYHPPESVYDIEVPIYNKFVANGIVCHNTAKSALMKVVSSLIPRGRYVSGKGVTTAGLTATVVRDEEFLGGWVLEAGALVMCNRSLCAIDEFEKVEKTDQIALHEAMEQQTISIAKANIVATLPARTSILAGGNPKLGRFDPYLPIKEQIDIPETLLARFDLKFALRDIPNPELDSKIAEHILKARHYEEEEIKPEIDPEFIKKYVAYARKNCHPKLTKEAGEIIKDFFVKLRERVSGEEAPVPITLRQYEALIRLAEASAKVQLRNEVIKEDAIRAINLMKASLRQFGFDPEIGKIDIDRAEGHISATQRSKIRVLIEVIEELTNTIGKNIPKEDIIKMAKSKGLKEFDIEKMLNELKNNGTLFEPRPGILQKM
ncbi:MAG: LAGLIDADG family homing endonuclease [Candidatus Aenigmatarchaeota archaeon]